MVVSNRPTGNVNDIRLIQAWRPAGSQTTLWAQDMASGRPLQLVQWGDKLYLPVTEGLRLGIGVYNGSSGWVAYPTYIEAKNLIDNAPSQPDDCASNEMSEAQPGTSIMMDALMSRDGQTGRPLIIVQHGLGMGIGEATFHTDAYRGQIRVYRRTRTDPIQPPVNPFPGFDGDPAFRHPLRDTLTEGDPVARKGGWESFGSGPETYDVPRGPGRHVFHGPPEVRADRQVGIGAGAEERRESHETGIQYSRNSQLVAALCVESRTDLVEVLRAARHEHIQWYWTPESPRWFATWTPSTMPGVSPQVPVAQPGPHNPSGWNRTGWHY